jgi:hypothetical protein
MALTMAFIAVFLTYYGVLPTTMWISPSKRGIFIETLINANSMLIY